jgi:hypothetical protein
MSTEWLSYSEMVSLYSSVQECIITNHGLTEHFDCHIGLKKG